MNEEDARQELEERFKANAEKLKALKEDFEDFNTALGLTVDQLDSVGDAYMSGDCEEAWVRVERNLRWIYGNVKQALELAPQFVNPEAEAGLKALLNRVENAQIGFYGWITRVREQAKVIQRPTGKLVCPSMLYYRGVDDMGKASHEDLEWCLTECPYQDRCDPKQQQIPAAP